MEVREPQEYHAAKKLVPESKPVARKVVMEPQFLHVLEKFVPAVSGIAGKEVRAQPYHA